MIKKIKKILSLIITYIGKTSLPNELKRFIEIQALLILIFILFGDSFKYGNMFGITQYNWIQGHFADIGLTAQFTTFFYYLYGHKRFGPYMSISLPPLLFTLYEFMQYPNTDPIDIVCYFFGSIAALISISLFKNKMKISV